MSELKPAFLFQDGCVLQRRKPIVVWGEGEEGKEVAVTLAQNSATGIVKDGKWECSLPAMEAAEGLTMRIECGGQEIVVKDVSIGEVWIAGGQSNMEYYLRYDAEWEDTCSQPFNGKIRMFNVPRLAFPEQEKDVSDCGYWFSEGDEAWERFSAPGYSFARSIQPSLGVPVGIIGCNWGGTSASTWMDASYMEEEPLNVYLKEYEAAIGGKDLEELKRQSVEAYRVEDDPDNGAAWAGVMYGISLEEQAEWVRKGKEDPAPVNPVGPYNICCPGRLYGQMLKRIIPYSVQGVLWYQGESDEVHPEIYDKLFAAMIRCWRDSFRQELPFLFVQVAPYGRWLENTGVQYPELRRSQQRAADTVPGAYMASIMDLGMYEDIHPKQKMEVGRRLALLARGKVYGEDILCEAPAPKSWERTEEGILITFENAGEGLWEMEELPEAEEEATVISELTGPEEMKEGFLLIQNGKNVPLDEVIVRDDQVLLKASSLEEGPCRVSFAEVPYLRVRIYNSADLAMKPFGCTV